MGLALALIAGCGSDDSPAAWLLDPTEPLPGWMSEAGIYAHLGELRPAEGFVEYLPPHPLFSNRSDKARLLWLPPGEVIDTTDPEHWRFPIGAVLVKTFTYNHVEGRLGRVAVETRVMRNGPDGWTYAVYHWGSRGDDARLAAPRWPEVPFLLEDVNGSDFPYVIPGELDCEACHETHISGAVIGLSQGNLDPELLTRDAIFDPVPEPLVLPATDDAEVRAMSYIVGNCVHCHHGAERGDNASFDLRPDALLDNTVNMPTDSSASGDGIRIVPGDPEGSALFEAVVNARMPGYRGQFKPMPPVGVVVGDRRAESALRAWIESL